MRIVYNQFITMVDRPDFVMDEALVKSVSRKKE